MEARWVSYCQTEGEPHTREFKEILFVLILHVLCKLGCLLRTDPRAWRQEDTVPVPSSSVAIKGHGEAQNIRGRKYSYRDLFNSEPSQCGEAGFAVDGVQKSLLRDS